MKARETKHRRSVWEFVPRLHGRAALAFFLITLLTAARGFPEQATTPGQEAKREQRIQMVSEAVLVDVVARDRRGRPIRDLKKEEIEVFEEGIKQEIISFRLIDETVYTVSRPSSRPAQPEPPPAITPRTDAQRHINLVTLVFERLGTEGRQLARQAALDFLAAQLRPNVYVAVFIIDHRLHVLQQFTNQVDLLRKAVDQATSGAYTQFASQSQAIERELAETAGLQEAAEAGVSGFGRGSSPTGGEGFGFAEARMAEMTLNILRYSESLQREQQGISSLYSLLSLIREQRRLSGRKTVIYFSEGLHVPPNLVDVLRTTISEANRSNVSVYAVDARGLTTAALTASSRSVMTQAANTSRQQVSRTGRAVTRDDVMAIEDAEASIRMNVQGALADLSTSTGGILIANTNDLRTGMQQVHEDITSHYELAYTPREIQYDGKFRQIAVTVSRPDVFLQTRSGYFAIPPSEGPPVLPHEIPLLAALNSTPLPQDFRYHARALRFGGDKRGTQHSLILEVPLSSFSFAEDSANSTYTTHFSLLALLKNGEGAVVEKFSQDYPLQGPLDKLEALKKGNIIFIRHVRLAPGRYTLETAAYDRETNQRSARRSLLVVPIEREGVKLSSLSLIRRVDVTAAEEKDLDNPLQIDRMKIVPDLGDLVQQGSATNLSLYLVVYPGAQQSESPQLSLDFILDGEVVGRGAPELPPPDAQGRIPYIATLPLNTLKPGSYEIRAVVQQGQSAAKEHLFLTINP